MMSDHMLDAFTETDGDRNLCRMVCQSVWTDIKNVARLIF